MSEKGAKKKDAKPVIISGTSKKPLLKDEPINMSDTNEYVMQYTDIFGAENGADVVDIQEGDAISDSSDTEIVAHSNEHANYEGHSDSDNESDGEYREGPPPLPDSDDESDTVNHHHNSLPTFTGIDSEDDVGEWDYEGPQSVSPPPLPTADSDNESSIQGSASPPPIQSADSDYESNVMNEQENGERPASTTESDHNVDLGTPPPITSENSDQDSNAADHDVPSPAMSEHSDQDSNAADPDVPSPAMSEHSDQDSNAADPDVPSPAMSEHSDKESDAKEEQDAGEEEFQDVEEEHIQVVLNADETRSAKEIEQTEITDDFVDSTSGEEGANSAEEIEEAQNIEESDGEKCDDETEESQEASHMMNTHDQVNHAASDDDNDEGSDAGEQTDQSAQEIKEEKSKLELISQEISIDSDAEDEKQAKEESIPVVNSQIDVLELNNDSKMETKTEIRNQSKNMHLSKKSTDTSVAKPQKGKLQHKYPGTAVKTDSEETSISSPSSEALKKDKRSVSSQRTPTPTNPTEQGKTGNKKPDVGFTTSADVHSQKTTHKKTADQSSSVGRVETNRKEKHRTKPQKMSAPLDPVSSEKDETLKDKPARTETAEDRQQTKSEKEEHVVESKSVVTRSGPGRKHERRSMSSRLAAATAESNTDKQAEHVQKKVAPLRTVSPPTGNETATKVDHKSKTSRPVSSSNVSVDSKSKSKPSRSSTGETSKSTKVSLSIGTDTEARTKPSRSATTEADVKRRSHVKTTRSVAANSKSLASTSTETDRRDSKQRPSKMVSVGTKTISVPELKPHQPEQKVKTRNKDIKSGSKKTRPSSVSIAVGTDDDMHDGEYNSNDDEVMARRLNEVQKACSKTKSHEIKKNGEPYHGHSWKDKSVQRNPAHEKQRKHEHIHHQKHDRKKHVWLCRDDEIHKLIAQKASMLKEYESGSLAGRKVFSGRKNADHPKDMSGIPDVGFAGKKPKNARVARPVSELIQENRLQKKEKRRSLQHFYSGSSSEDEDERTNQSAANQQKARGSTFAVGIASRKFVKESEHEDESDHEETCEYCMAEKAEREAKQRNPAWEGPHHPRNLLLGVVYSSKYLGSTQIISPQSPNRAIRMQQAQEAMGRIKVPEGEDQPTTDVDVFISTERLKVVNAASKEVMMDHGLRNVSFIADIGDILVLMARRDAADKDKDLETRPSQILASIGTGTTDRETIKITCHVFQSEEAQLIAKSIGQAFNVAYQEFLKKNGLSEENIEDAEYSGVLEAQKILGEDLSLLADESKAKEVVVNKKPAEMLGVMIVESGWGSMIPTAIIAHLAKDGAAAKSGQLNVGDQILAVNGTSFVGLPLTECQTAIKNTRPGTKAVLKIVSCPPTVQVSVNRPDTKYQLGFSVQNGMICSLMRGSIAERGGVRVGHRIIEINGESVVATSHQRIVELLATTVGEIRMKTMPAAMYRLLVGLDTPIHI